MAVARAYGRSYGLMLRYEYATARAWLPFWLGLQLILAVGSSFMYGYYIPNLTETQAIFIVTGAPTMALMPIGFVMLPFAITTQRTAKTFDFTWSLPVPRSMSVASTLTIYTLVALPGIVLALIIASWHYGVTLSISPSIVPAVLLCSLMAASVGLGIAFLIKSSIVVGLLTNVLLFVALMFSPISMPISNFPDWLADIQRFFPLYHMANVVRAGLTTGIVQDVATSYAMLTIWTIVGLVTAGWIIGRRD